jgi:hypothetical protein
MKILDTSQIVDPTAQQPFTGPSCNYVQNAYIEIGEALLGSIVHNPSVNTIIQGCTYTQAGATYTIQPGWLAAGGNIYHVNGASVTTGVTAPNIVAYVVTSDDGLGQVMFSDNVARTVFLDTQVYLSAGTATSGNNFLQFENVCGNSQQINAATLPMTTLGGTGNVTGVMNYKMQGKTAICNFQLTYTVTGGSTTGFKINVSNYFTPFKNATIDFVHNALGNDGTVWYVEYGASETLGYIQFVAASLTTTSYAVNVSIPIDIQ